MICIFLYYFFLTYERLLPHFLLNTLDQVQHTFTAFQSEIRVLHFIYRYVHRSGERLDLYSSCGLESSLQEK